MAAGRGIDFLEPIIGEKTHYTKTGMKFFQIEHQREINVLINAVGQLLTHVSPRWVGGGGVSKIWEYISIGYT